MKASANLISYARRRKGLALLTVVSVLVLATALLLALFSTTQTELQSTVAYSEGVMARAHADSAVNLVINQIQSASNQDETVNGLEIWTSQPGMARQYRENGTLLRGNKLYSDSKMIATTEREIIEDVPASDWNERKDKYVDMNEPVVRPGSTAGSQRVYFPIIDPRAASLEAERNVEGFSYTNFANGTSGAALNGVVLPGGGENEVNQRLPMPVEWLYVLRDGSLGCLDDRGRFVGATGQQPTRENPIVSRIAFWTDDESCKININTAGEGTNWDTPRLYHERDGEWARFQPMMYEYQRYPGHPATVAMSSLLYPGVDMNPMVSDTEKFEKARAYKEKIYELMPKILPGGSQAGSVLVPVARPFKPTDFKNVQDALRERLFASVDEFLLRPDVDGSGERQEIDLGDTGFWTGMKRSDVLERLRFFLTPRSRAPELNPFGLPKIAMWPLHRNKSADYRTVFDQTIAYCATLGGRDYYFTRQDCTSQTELSGIPRNMQLYNHLLAMMKEPIPGFGTTASATFDNKYGDNLQQILIEIFDYIRSTNLYDETIAEKAVGENPAGVNYGLPDSRLTAYQPGVGLRSKTFTPIRNGTGSSIPGHGQVMPTVLPKARDEVYRGMGRFLTISEVGLQFVCNGQGTDTAGGKTAAKLNPKVPPPVTGYTPPNWRGPEWGDNNFWYSNFPPLSEENAKPENGFYKSKYPTAHKLEGHDGDSPEHPGYNPMNWNWTLDKDKPMANGTKRVQATFLLEWFSPSTGWTLINPDVAIEVDASSLTLGGKKMFPVNGGKTLIRPFAHMSNAWGVYQRGGTISYRAFLQGRKLPAVAAGANGNTAGSLLEDTSYKQYSTKTGILKDCNQYNLVSDFLDIPDGENQPINFGGGTVVVKILANEDKPSPRVLQTFNFEFPARNFTSPILATKNEDTSWGQHSDGTWWVKQPVPAPYWWALHADGALGRDTSGKITSIAAADKTRMGGRFRFIGNEIGSYGDAPNGGTYNRGNLVIPDDTLQSLVLRHGDPRLTMGQFVVPASEFEEHRYYGQQRLAHNIVLAHWSEGPGLDRGEDKKGWRLVKDANYAASFLPDHPYSPATGVGLQKYGDFDRGITNQTDGAYINKPDEGNTYTKENITTGEKLVPYFTDPWVSYSGGSTYFSPNRQVASPGMLGSLPTGVHDAGATPAGRKREAWRTLLFRPQTWSLNMGQQVHIGAPRTLKGYGPSGLVIQGVDPPDHLFMDFFWMPVVEPYAISEPGSTAGKLNINFQIAPFRHITRSTGLHAAMKSEVLTAVAHSDANVYLTRPGGAPSNGSQAWFWQGIDTGTRGKKYWHRQIDAGATMKIFQERFNSGFAFISPAQICEMYLLPKKGGTQDTLVPEEWPDKISGLLRPTATDSILQFWEKHAITAENLKERPYTNLYPRLTTRSNTFQVYVRAQTIRKARSTDPTEFDSTKDTVSAEYRGSAVIERYLDLNDPALKNIDFASGAPGSRPSLETYHRFRVLSQKRFNP